jgi:hypothetical protein
MMKSRMLRAVLLVTLSLLPLPLGCDSGPTPSAGGGAEAKAAPAPQVLSQGKVKGARAPAQSQPTGARD